MRPSFLRTAKRSLSCHLSRLGAVLPALVGLTLLAPHAARAEEGGEEPYSIVYAQRPLTLDAKKFVFTGALGFGKTEHVDKLGVDLNLSIDYGVMKDLTVGALLVPLGLSPKVEYGNPFIYGRYQFMHGKIELAAELGASIPVVKDTHFGLAPGVRAAFIINDAAKLDVGLFVDLSFDDPVVTRLDIPLALAISFTRELFFEVRTGVQMAKFKPELLTIPLGVELGYSIAKGHDEPFIDVFLGFGFPEFLGPETKATTTGVETSTGLHTGDWDLEVGARIFY